MEFHGKRDIQSAQYNVYIFNFIEHNERDVARLKQTFAQQNCWVKEFRQPTYAEFKQAVENIINSSFILYEYIVIVVLDRRNSSKYMLRTIDNRDVYLNDELLTYIQRNPTLAEKKRLFIIQTNQNTIEDHLYRPCSSINKGVLYAGPTITLSGLVSDKLLENHWPEPNAVESPFIKAFCDNFDRYAETLNIKELYRTIYADMERKNCHNMPVIEENLRSSESGIFGKALDEDCIRDFFNNHPDNPRRHKSFSKTSILHKSPDDLN